MQGCGVLTGFLANQARPGAGMMLSEAAVGSGGIPFLRLLPEIERKECLYACQPEKMKPEHRASLSSFHVHADHLGISL